MASLAKLLPENVPGEFFVDSTCIDCDTCRQLAPQTFGETGEFSFVKQQPADEPAARDALRALVCCPTGSIGTRGSSRAKEVLHDFPLRIDGEVFYCGFNSPKSFGGNSYFIRHPAGNWLIDSPKYLPLLAKQFEQLGGLAYIFLTHRDDVADADRYAQHFHARRIIHRDELDSQPDAEQVLEGDESIELVPGFVAIPTPGHTRGHLVLLHDRRTCGGTATTSASAPRAATAGTPGRGRSNRWPACSIIRLSGSFPGMASESASPAMRCSRSSPGSSSGCGPRDSIRGAVDRLISSASRILSGNRFDDDHLSPVAGPPAYSHRRESCRRAAFGGARPGSARR
jgi:ferredoxin